MSQYLYERDYNIDVSIYCASPVDVYINQEETVTVQYGPRRNS